MAAYYDQIQEAAEALRAKLAGRSPEIGLILGSGLGDLANEIADAAVMRYEELPHLPVSTVEGHAGQFAAGVLEGKPVIAMQGRFHYYEGYPMRQVVFPVYVMKQLGVKTLIITNAAGGMNRSFQPGDLMVIQDHINWTGDNPLAGAYDPRLGVRFPDLSDVYDREYRELLKHIAAREQVRLAEGVYCGISGPAYNTPAELIMLRRLGADAVGMSTVPEAIAARHAGLRVLGISCITDMAIGEELEPLTHEQVVAVAERAKPAFQHLVRSFVREVEV